MQKKTFNNLNIIFIVMTCFVCSFKVTAMGNLKVEKQYEINASSETVWKMIGDYNHLDVWHPVVVGSKVNKNENKPGVIRILTLGDGAKITEELVAHSNENMTYTYTITESPLPVSDYVATIDVNQNGNGKTIVSWTSNFNSDGVDDKKAMEIVSGIYDAGLQSLEKHFSK